MLFFTEFPGVKQNPKSEYRNPKKIQIFEIPMTQTPLQYSILVGHVGLEHLSVRILYLPFDLAQGGEPVEPFPASGLGFRILRHFI
jgi:hypothetical protein